MVLSRRLTILALCIAISGLAAGGLYAQLESGERGILPIDSSGTLEITGIKVDVGGKTAAEARFNGWRNVPARILMVSMTDLNSHETESAPGTAAGSQAGHLTLEPQQILLGVLQFPQCLPPVRLELGDAAGLFKHQPPVFRT